MGNTSKRYSSEVQELAVRLFQEHVHDYPTLGSDAVDRREDRLYGRSIQRVWEENFRVYGARRSGGSCVAKAFLPHAARSSG